MSVCVCASVCVVTISGSMTEVRNANVQRRSMSTTLCHIHRNASPMKPSSRPNTASFCNCSLLFHTFADLHVVRETSFAVSRIYKPSTEIFNNCFLPFRVRHITTLNVKMIQTGSSDVCGWTLRELVRGDVQGRLGGIVSRWIWKVLVCPVRMEIENRGGGRLTRIYPDNDG